MNRNIVAELKEVEGWINRGRTPPTPTVEQLEAEIRRLHYVISLHRKDVARWNFVSNLMEHQSAGPHVGWTLDALLPGDDPDSAVDAAIRKEADQYAQDLRADRDEDEPDQYNR